MDSGFGLGRTHSSVRTDDLGDLLHRDPGGRNLGVAQGAVQDHLTLGKEVPGTRLTAQLHLLANQGGVDISEFEARLLLGEDLDVARLPALDDDGDASSMF